MCVSACARAKSLAPPKVMESIDQTRLRLVPEAWNLCLIVVGLTPMDESNVELADLHEPGCEYRFPPLSGLLKPKASAMRSVEVQVIQS